MKLFYLSMFRIPYMLQTFFCRHSSPRSSTSSYDIHSPAEEQSRSCSASCTCPLAAPSQPSPPQDSRTSPPLHPLTMLFCAICATVFADYILCPPWRDYATAASSSSRLALPVSTGIFPVIFNRTPEHSLTHLLTGTLDIR